jgi:hypothetical protein
MDSPWEEIVNTHEMLDDTDLETFAEAIRPYIDECAMQDYRREELDMHDQFLREACYDDE